MEHYCVNVLNLCINIIELVRKANLVTDDNLPLTLSLLNPAPPQNKKFSKTCMRRIYRPRILIDPTDINRGIITISHPSQEKEVILEPARL